MAKAKSYLVLGGGITGLATAWFLSRLAPSTTRITLVEKQSRMGGWVHTRHQTGQVFELGPRTLRPVGEPGKATLDMIYQLNLQSSLITTSKTSPAAINRYIYKASTLHHLPTSPFDLLLPWRKRSPILKGLLSTLLREPFVPPRPKSLADESIHSFVSRRFSKRMADDLVSAVLHGIYAGDARRLSVRSAMPFLWDAEGKHGSVARGILAPPTAAVSPVPSPAPVPGETAVRRGRESGDRARDDFVRDVQTKASIFSFKDGMQTLTEAIHRDLETKENVELVRGTVEGIEFGEDTCEVTLSESPDSPLRATHIISALPSCTLHSLLPPTLPVLTTHLASIPTVTVATINLAFRGTPSTVHPKMDGFGYLIPLTEPTAILGCVLDSCAMPDQDSGSLTRMTVMLGGHRFSLLDGGVDRLTEDKARTLALEAVRTHVGVTAELVHSHVAIHRDCIPQYVVGHREGLVEIHAAIEEGVARGRLSVVGASYLGVGVNDCIKGARDLVRALVDGRDVTGLERVVQEQ
ncbi:oxygen-dependent protoporphyrinogen oxidase [Thoreauomyces humboldtii]|nr:oxygen-dependent protoporphyrinogen oxidase [Thoreauomyces humboldtii]